MSDIECSKWPRYADGVFHLAIQKPRRLAAGQIYCIVYWLKSNI